MDVTREWESIYSCRNSSVIISPQKISKQHIKSLSVPLLLELEHGYHTGITCLKSHQKHCCPWLWQGTSQLIFKIHKRKYNDHSFKSFHKWSAYQLLHASSWLWALFMVEVPLRYNFIASWESVLNSLASSSSIVTRTLRKSCLLYSASTLDLATTVFYFSWVPRSRKISPTKVNYTEIDLLLPTKPAHFASGQFSTFKELCLVKSNPSPTPYFKHLNARSMESMWRELCIN